MLVSEVYLAREPAHRGSLACATLTRFSAHSNRMTSGALNLLETFSSALISQPHEQRGHRFAGKAGASSETHAALHRRTRNQVPRRRTLLRVRMKPLPRPRILCRASRPSPRATGVKN